MIRFTCLLAMLLVTPALAAPMTAWDAKDNGDPKTYSVQGLKLTFASGKDAGNLVIPTLTIRAPGAAPFEVDGEAGLDSAAATFGVGRFDLKATAPQVVFASYTGGAHCCTRVMVIERQGAGWKKVDLGMWDGDSLQNALTDIDGDGATDFVFRDNNFLYAFSSYAASWAPPQIVNVVGGKAVDVSAAPGYRKLFEIDMAKVKPECARHQNGACADYAADAARLGQFETGWKFVLANYDRQSDWDNPTHCAGAMRHGECLGKVVTPKDYPQALRWFLEDNRYIARETPR